MDNGNTWNIDKNSLDQPRTSSRYLDHASSLQGAVRIEVIRRQLAPHIPDQPAHILDIGGGAGHQAIPLARLGHEVTVLDPDSSMLSAAEQSLVHEDADVRSRVRLILGLGEHAGRLLQNRAYDVVICHGVLLYVEDPAPLLSSISDATRPGGVVSLVTKNATALPMRPGLMGQFAEATRLLLSPQTVEVGTLGVITRADTIDSLTRLAETNGLTTRDWYGVRIFTDHIPECPVDNRLAPAVSLELAAGARDPYRQLARLLHLVLSKRR